MNLKELLKDCKYELINGSLDKYITEISYDSRKIKKDNLFVALTGFMVDGHKYIESAIKNGANTILVEQDIKNDNQDITIIKVENTRRTLATISRTFYNYPDKELTTIGITGTKGKTTTSWTIMKILEESGNNAGCIGTMGVFFKNKYYHTVNTSPESYDVYKYMREMLNDGVKYLVMEVSSQSLKLHRWEDMTFDYAVFTNLSLDHIGGDEHESYEDYIYCKSLLFKQCKIGLFNLDDKEYHKMTHNFTGKAYTFGVNKKADLRLVKSQNIIKPGFIGIEMEVEGLINNKFKVSIPGKFNAYNMMCALAIGKLLNIDIESMKKTLSHISVKGRLEPVKVSDKFNVLIDYAYQGIAMENVIKTIREANPKRIVVVFGCGGNRSKQRRYDCGKIASTYADYSILTADNSRYENVNDIINDILTTFTKKDNNYIIIPDRKAAIKYSIVNAREGDVIMILGKGHEDYQEINGIRHPFDERVIIKEILNELTEEEKKNL
jgi:UDP-N-acetylmuramoyl-L-alanyl-D-glutamate--2,6-diaminopimelate ligase